MLRDPGEGQDSLGTAGPTGRPLHSALDVSCHLGEAVLKTDVLKVGRVSVGSSQVTPASRAPGLTATRMTTTTSRPTQGHVMTRQVLTRLRPSPCSRASNLRVVVRLRALRPR